MSVIIERGTIMYTVSTQAAFVSGKVLNDVMNTDETMIVVLSGKTPHRITTDVYGLFQRTKSLALLKFQEHQRLQLRKATDKLNNEIFHDNLREAGELK